MLLVRIEQKKEFYYDVDFENMEEVQLHVFQYLQKLPVVNEEIELLFH
jgi:hypothetical protein